MKSCLLILLLGCTATQAFCQQSPQLKIDTTAQSEQDLIKWTHDLYDMGQVFTKDSFIVSQEFKKAMQDTAYRLLLYPKKYTWQAAIALMKGLELKKAFWYLIKLYGNDTANRRYVIGTVLALDSKLDLDKALTAAFYTYGLGDPDVCTIKNNRPEITRPDIVQKELNDVKQICVYIRAKRQPGNSNNSK